MSSKRARRERKKALKQLDKATTAALNEGLADEIYELARLIDGTPCREHYITEAGWCRVNLSTVRPWAELLFVDEIAEATSEAGTQGYVLDVPALVGQFVRQWWSSPPELTVLAAMAFCQRLAAAS